MLKKILICILLAAFASPLAAADKPADTTQFVYEKLKSDKKLLVAENLQLTDSEAKNFWPLYERYQSELFLLRMRTLQLVKDYESTYQNMTDSIAKRILDEALEIETLRLKLITTYLLQFRAVLPETKVARYYQIENKINALLYHELAIRIPLMATEKKQH